MTPRRKRMAFVAAIVLGVGMAGALALRAFQDNVMFFFDPTQIATGQAPKGERFRLGGMVTKGSVVRAPGSLEVHFVVTDFKHDVPVSYTGVLPDLFKEGTGVVAHGRLTPQGVFVADEVLAKHDENYMPPEVTRSLKSGQQAATASPAGSPQAPSPSASAAAPTLPAAATFASGKVPDAS